MQIIRTGCAAFEPATSNPCTVHTQPSIRNSKAKAAPQNFTTTISQAANYDHLTSTHSPTATPQLWRLNWLSRASALTRSSLTSSSTPSARVERPRESERVAGDGSRTLVLVSGHQRTPLRATTLVGHQHLCIDTIWTMANL